MGPIHQQRVVSCCALAALLLFPLRLVGAEMVIIGGQHAPVTLTRDQVSDVFLGKITSFPDGSTAIPVDQPETSPLREAFYLKVTNKSAAQARAYWAKLYFTGRGVPPREGASSEDVKSIVNSTPGALGYIDSSSIDDSVRVILVIP